MSEGSKTPRVEAFQLPSEALLDFYSGLVTLRVLLNVLGGQLTRLAERVEELSRCIEALSERLERLREDVERGKACLEAEVKELQRRVIALEDRQEELDRKLDEILLVGRESALSLASLHSRLAAEASRIGTELKELRMAQASRLVSLVHELRELGCSVSELRLLLADLSVRLGKLEDILKSRVGEAEAEEPA